MVPHLTRFYLSVLVPVAAGGHCVNVFRIEHPAGLQWTREHADELAAKCYGPGYDALMVHETDPYPAAPRVLAMDRPVPGVVFHVGRNYINPANFAPCPTCPHGRGFHCRMCWPA